MEAFCGYRDCDSSSATLICSRCQSEYYCSKKCQVNAFQMHRFNCFELPSLRSIASYKLSPQLSSMSLNSEVKVIYTQKEAVMSPSVQPTQASPVNVEKNKAEDPLPPVAETVLPKNVEEVTAPKNEAKKTQEAPKIEEKKTQEATNSRLKEFPAAVNRTVLDERENEKRPSIISSFFKTQTPEQQQPPKEEPRYFYRDLKQCPLPTQKFKANFLAGDTEDKIFSIVDIANSSVLQSIESAIAEITDKDTSGTPYAPKKDEVVLAKFEGSYYRGVVKARQAEGFLIHYIDFGNLATVPEQDIKKLGKKLLEFNVVVHSCYMENFPDEITSKVAEILGNENGINIENVTKGTKEGTYVARISGL